MSQANYFDRLSRLQVLLFGWVYTIAFYSNRLLTNASTPGGDAKRSLGYFETAKESSSYLPLWDPFMAMGKPAFADPEWLFYRIIAPLFNAIPRDYYNLSYNLVLLFLLMTLMLVLYSLARVLNINRFLSGFISTLAICSGFAWSAVESGRLNTLVILITTFALIPVYRNWFTSKKALSLITLVLLIAVNLVLSGYYALVAYSFFACFVYGVHLQKLKSYSSAFFYTTLHLMCLGLLGLFTSAIFILPMLESQLTNLVTSAGWGNGFSALSILSTPRMFVPFFAEQPLLSSAFPYIGFVLLPGLFGLFRATIFKQNTAFLCLSVFSLICFVLAVGMALPASYFERIYNTIPVINLIRWGNLYGLYSMLLLILITTIGFSQLKTTSEIRRAVTISTLLVSFGLLVTELFAKSPPDLRDFKIEIAVLLIVFMLGTWLVCKNLSGKKAFYCTLLIGLCVHLVTPRAAFFSHKSLIETPRTNNLITFESAHELQHNFTLGVRQYCLSMLSCPLSGLPAVYAANGFSMFFPEPTRAAFSYIRNKQVDVQRPHWLRQVRCPELSSQGLEMANVKLVFCRGELKPPGEQWRSVLNTREGSLWSDFADQSPFRFFYSAQKVNDSMTFSDIDRMWDNNVLLVDFDDIKVNNTSNRTQLSRVEILDWNDDSYKISVHSSEPAYLFSSVIFNAGWSAKINSSAVTIIKAFSSYQAIQIPAGDSIIEFKYEPLTWRYAKWLSFFSLILVVFLAFVMQSRNSTGSAITIKY